MAMMRKPWERLKTEDSVPVKTEIRVERLVVNPLFKLGQYVAKALIIGIQQQKQSGYKTPVILPLYTVRVPDGRILDVPQETLVTKLRGKIDIPRAMTLGTVIADGGRRWEVRNDKGIWAKMQVACRDEYTNYLDSYARSVTKIIHGAMARMVMYMGSIPLPFIPGKDKVGIDEQDHCYNCVYLRHLRGSDVDCGDHDARMYSTGTWDKESYFKNDRRCAWTNDSPPGMDSQYDQANKLLRTGSTGVKLDLIGINLGCPQYVDRGDWDDYFPSMNEYDVDFDRSRMMTQINLPGWRLALY